MRLSLARRRDSGRHTGFTLIELIVVITLIAILAAIALPRLIDIGREARIAKLNAARGAVASGAALANSLALARGLGPNTTVTMEGGNVTMSNGYPTADAAGIPIAAGIGAPDYSFEIGNASDPLNTIRVKVAGGSNINLCYFSYTSPIATGNTPLLTDPALTLSGC